MAIRHTVLFLILLASILWSYGPDAGETPAAPNFLVLIGDDLGLETLSCYGIGASPARTPTLDRLCSQGMRFDNFWAQPMSSPTRATILTGQFGFRNGVGTSASGPAVNYPVPELRSDAGNEVPYEHAARELRADPASVGGGIRRHARPGLSRDAYGLPRALSADPDLGYVTAAIGKWHLSDAVNGGLDHPSVVGFDHYAGPLHGDSVESYFAWSEVVNGRVTGGRSGYATSATVDDAIAWFDYAATDKSWLLWIGFNAPHAPLGPPPADLLSAETAAVLGDADSQTHFSAMIEAMDTEIGRLLSAIGPEALDNTYIIFLGDNGTAANVVTPPYDASHSKGTVYQGGINVPLLISGPGVTAGTNSAALANSVDLFATILELAGTADDARLDAVTHDAISLVPVLGDHTKRVRKFAYADVYGPQQNQMVNRRAIRNHRYKLVMDLQNDSEELYDLSNDPYEHRDLLNEALAPEAQENYDQLVARLLELLAGGQASSQPSRHHPTMSGIAVD